MAPSMDIDVTMEKKKKNKSKDLTEAQEVMDYADDSSRKEKKKKKKKDNDSALIQLIAKYLEKRNLHKSLSSFLSETQCKSSWKTQTMDLEDIYNQYSIQDSENLKKHNVEERNVEQENNHLSINDQSNNLKLLEEEVQTEDANKVVNSNVAPSSKGDLKISGALDPHVSRSDKSSGSCDNAQSELAKSKDKKRKAPGKDIDTDSEKKPRQSDLVNLEKYLQEPVEVPKEVKNKKKKNTEHKVLIDNDEHKPSNHKENRSPIKDNNTSQESTEVLKEDHKKKKKNSVDKDLIVDNEKETSTNIENGNSIKEKSKRSKTSQKNKESGKVDRSFQEALDVPTEEEKKKKKNSSEDKGLESTEVPKQKRKKEQEAEDGDSGDDANQNCSKKNKKDNKGCKKKLPSASSNATSEEAANSNLNGLAEDTDKPLFDITPGQKGVKEDEREANISLNSKQKSGEPTTAKAFQRVKVEEVEFVDPRLQDNSYWAKSGAEIGYGAKAEHVLGQVRGKDFRHEKTKKKRGSYKGGMIDLQSHSIKFSYSDEE
ncbi:hypothetical protein SUGI_1150190 [Cryptomeria japonica]|uniref:suppressor protein SRP40 n=1 Tax=Cryptomeria japonica TaxID=3369 RepID=UPI002414AFC4|nr:suppressor protein SRP40 [Cryptomeria japonica]GLJ53863.1 hypothetical protein SUGI_1150190 [Cryptomeria japonica]